MLLATVLEPLSDHNIALAAQAGVDVVVLRYPAWHGADLASLVKRVESCGMHCGVVEGYLPIEAIKLGQPAREGELRQILELLRAMGDLRIPVLCYNFMAGSDWSRTSTTARERGGALVTAFEPDQLPVAPVDATVRLTPDDLWANLAWFLERALPAAERAGVTLAMHPDDPPLPDVAGQSRIMHDVAGFERLVRLAPSPANAICFCQGTFAEMGVDIPATIRRLGPHIRYVHFRDVRRTAHGFVETFHDNGETDMVAAMRSYRAIGFDGCMRPDHVPQMDGEEGGSPGYTMLGRLFAYGYIRALMQATAP